MLYKTQEDALRHARSEKRKHCLGRDWKIYAHENLGWHWSFDNGSNIHVSPYIRKNKVLCYLCFMGKNHSGTFAEYGRTPQACVRNTLKKVKLRVRSYNKLINEAERVLKSS